jgi:hypothetical protein
VESEEGESPEAWRGLSRMEWKAIFKNDEGFDFDTVAGSGERALARNSSVRAAISRSVSPSAGFASSGKAAGGFVAHGEGVVAQNAASLAVTVFHCGHDDIERGEAFLSLIHARPRRPGLVGTRRGP